MAQGKRTAEIRGYLVINLVLVVMLLLGLHFGGAIWDTTIRLPGLLGWLVMINAIMVMRAAWSVTARSRETGRAATTTDATAAGSGSAPTPADALPASAVSPAGSHLQPTALRGAADQNAFDREPAAPTVVPDREIADDLGDLRRALAAGGTPGEAHLRRVLACARASVHDAGGMLLLIDEHGIARELAVDGRPPTGLARIRWQVRGNRLVASLPAGLADQDLGSWPPATGGTIFESPVLRDSARVVFLQAIGRPGGLWIRWTSPTGRASSDPDPIATAPGPHREAVPALALEAALGMHLLESLWAAGSPVDPRTGLLRPETFDEHLEREIERSERYQQPLTLMFIRIRALECGANSAPGDAVPTGPGVAALAASGGQAAHPTRSAPTTAPTGLPALARAMRESLRRLDLMIGTDRPDQVAAILTESNAELACRVGQRLQNSFARHSATDQRPAGMAIDLGFACHPTHATAPQGLVEKAREALARAIAQASPSIVGWQDE